MKSIVYIIIISYFLTFLYRSDAAEIPSTNYNIVDSLLTISSTDICNYIKKHSISNVDIVLSGSGGESILKQRIADCAADSIRKFFQSAELKGKMPNLLDILIDSIYVKFENDINSDDKLIRKIEIIISVIYTDEENKINEPERIRKSYTDNIYRDQAANIMNESYPFTLADLPEEPPSFWRDILEPAVIIGSVAAVVILLFTVRSD